MKKTVLFTTQPECYSQALEETEFSCNIFTESAQLQRYLYEYQPAVILIDIDSVRYVQTGLLTNFDENNHYHPMVIFATCEKLKNLLLGGFSGRRETDVTVIPEEMNKIFDTALLQLHFSPTLCGYRYIKQAFYFEHLHSQLISYGQKDIYESVSDCYNTSVSSVERGIRFAISKAYRESQQEFQSIFKHLEKAPSNLTFLKTLYIHMQQLGLI